MAYREETVYSEREFMKQSNMIGEKTSGVTLSSDDANVEVGQRMKAGTALYHNGTRYTPVTDNVDDGAGGTRAVTAADLNRAGLLAHDVDIVDGNNLAGMITHGVPDESKCTGVNEAFKEATKGRLLFDM
jgi:hypothetical protein